MGNGTVECLKANANLLVETFCEFRKNAQYPIGDKTFAVACSSKERLEKGTCPLKRPYDDGQRDADDLRQDIMTGFDAIRKGMRLYFAGLKQKPRIKAYETNIETFLKTFE